VSEVVVQPKKQNTRKWLWISAVAIAVVAASCVALSAYVGWNLTHPDRETVYETPEKYGLAYEDITFQSRLDKLKLKGWFLPSKNENGMTIVVAHGYGKNRMQDDVPVLELAKSLSQKGYNLVMFDFRNSGESEGNLTSVGQYEKYDLLGAIDWAGKNTDDKIVLLGYSMGAATALITAAEAPEVSAVIADSPFNNLKNYLSENLSVWSGLPKYPFTPLIMMMIPTATGTDPEQVNPLKAIDEIYPRPVLFIHGKGDKSIPYKNSKSMAEKYPGTFQLMLVDKADHVKSYSVDPAVYVAKVDGFLQSSLRK
jgi:pimeloyl-ACP methyl ester carboxylesterase